MQGKIMKGIAGFYYVDTVESGIYECKAKGIFRKEKKKPLVGDNVEIVVTHEGDREGNIISILPRENEMVRPAAANVDQALVLFALKSPDPNLLLLDRFLLSMEKRGISAAILFNKADLVDGPEREKHRKIYSGSGYKVFFSSLKAGVGLAEIREYLEGKTTLLAGPSGAGKSTLTNACQDNVRMEVGEISAKLMRGKNTTRHTQLIPCGGRTYLMDTPGFTSFDIEDIEKEELRFYYNEFAPFEGKCRFDGCVHVHEPDCAVKAALDEGRINSDRYKNYCEIYEALKGKQRY
ncbi:MAG: ribosome small subunit-dependent GTPase A [Lachnospiraceae bacterium]|nr:ribosome small subunit-dependent GTPase A [Lachnospiraceae bacterium]